MKGKAPRKRAPFFIESKTKLYFGVILNDSFNLLFYLLIQ